MQSNDYSAAFQPDFSQFMQAPQQPAQGQPAPQASSYPTLPNAYGLGTQQGFQQQDPYAQQKQEAQSQIMANSSHGFNPWSLQGESNSR